MQNIIIVESVYNDMLFQIFWCNVWRFVCLIFYMLNNDSTYKHQKEQTLSILCPQTKIYTIFSIN